MTIRFDKYAAMLGWFSRREAKHVCKHNTFLLNGEPLTNVASKINVGDTLEREEYDLSLEVRLDVSVALHKPSGYISSDRYEHGWPSYRKLLQDFPYTNMLHVAGRLDQDTEGLLFLTSNGKLTHRIITPKKKIPKVYYVQTQKEITDSDVRLLQAGVQLDDGSTTLPAGCTLLDKNTIELTLVEGKFHQVKRMLQAVGNQVSYLKRLRIGGLDLSDIIHTGERKMLTDSDIDSIFSVGKLAPNS